MYFGFIKINEIITIIAERIIFNLELRIHLESLLARNSERNDKNQRKNRNRTEKMGEYIVSIEPIMLERKEQKVCNSYCYTFCCLLYQNGKTFNFIQNITLIIGGSAGSFNLHLHKINRHKYSLVWKC